jgi:integral membrane protein
MTLSRALQFYRVMAYVVGVGLIAVFVCIPFDSVEAVLGPIHGFLYIVYLLAALLLVIRARLPWWTWLVMATGGWLPFAAFVVERWVTRRIRAPAPVAR